MTVALLSINALWSQCVDPQIVSVSYIDDDPCMTEVSFELDFGNGPVPNVDLFILSYRIDMGNGYEPVDGDDIILTNEGVLAGMNVSTSGVIYNQTGNFVSLNTFSGTMANVNVHGMEPGECTTIMVSVEYSAANGTPCTSNLSHIVCFQEMDYGSACGNVSGIGGCPVESNLIATVFGNCGNEELSQGIPNSDGDFCVSVPEGGCTEIEIQNCPECELSLTDVIEGRKFALGIKDEIEGNPYAAIFGDVNGDGKYTTLDLVLIQRKILGYEELTGSSGECLVFDPSQVSINAQSFTGTVTSEICDDDDVDLVYGIMGDINGDCICADEEEKPSKVLSLSKRYSSDGVELRFTKIVQFYDLFIELEVSKEIDLNKVTFPNNMKPTGILQAGNTVKLAFNSKDNVPFRIDAKQPIISMPLAAVQVMENSFMVDHDVAWVALSDNSRQTYNRTAEEISKIDVFASNSEVFIKSNSAEENVSIMITDLSGRIVFYNPDMGLNAGLNELTSLEQIGVFVVTILNKDNTFSYKVVNF